jgi:hypothetical protein
MRAVLSGLLLVAACDVGSLRVDREEAPPSAASEMSPRRAPAPTTSAGRALVSPPSAAPSAAPPASSPEAPSPGPTALRFETFAEHANGCQLLGADETSTYLAPGLGGWRHVLRVASDGAESEVALSEPMASHRVAGGWIYGCVGKGLGQSTCAVGRARVEDGKVERLAVRGAVLPGGIFVAGDRLHTLELSEDDGGRLIPRFMSGGLREGPGIPNALADPHYAAVDGDVVLLATGSTAPQAKTYILRGGASPSLLLEGEFVIRPELDGSWLYYDSELQLVRRPLAGGTPEVLGSLGEARMPAHFTVTARHVIKAEVAETSPKVQLRLLRAEKPAR